jgi:RHS repeat-associated protein
MDDKQRIALVETKTIENGATINSPAPLQRYQLSNHLGSASVELDHLAHLISYEEYHPYGTTSFQAMDGASEVSLKRYRYSGKERDEETSFAYFGLRYYALWLGRWTAPDPASLRDGPNLYEYARANPVTLIDQFGTDSGPATMALPKPDGFLGVVGWRHGVGLETTQHTWEDTRPIISEIMLLGYSTYENCTANVDPNELFDRGAALFAQEHGLEQQYKEAIGAGEAWKEKLRLGVKSREDNYFASETTPQQREDAEYRRYQARLGAFQLWEELVASIGLPGMAGPGPSEPLPGREYQSGAPLEPLARTARLPEMTIRYTDKMASSPTDAQFLRFNAEWAQTSRGFLTLGKRNSSDASLRGSARRWMDKKGLDRTGREAMHPLDSAINPWIQSGTPGRTYYFGSESVNQSFGGQLGREIRRLGLSLGDNFIIRFLGFPTFEEVRPIAPISSPPNK